MNVLEVKHLTKKFPTFLLDDVSFFLERGKITGFIGRNGAGKSTTLNSLFHFVHPDNGEIRFWGENILDNEREIKQRVGFVSSGINYYPNKKLKVISDITKSFYEDWDEEAYRRYMELFNLDEKKTPKQLSAGMKVKYALALALSHRAELLILDEPTSGLDPVSREELLEIFMFLSDEGKTILFSTHITSDLEQCADQIIYIKDGVIQADSNFDTFVSGYSMIRYEKGTLDGELEDCLISAKRTRRGMVSLIKAEDEPRFVGKATIMEASLESIMVHLESEETVWVN
ncbi:MAG: ABC transporter ATP-binding protein [Eubacterium sp.]|nr:ABC transporter ATP-binding protein [Eubacterium sp.]